MLILVSAKILIKYWCYLYSIRKVNGLSLVLSKPNHQICRPVKLLSKPDPKGFLRKVKPSICRLLRVGPGWVPIDRPTYMGLFTNNKKKRGGVCKHLK